MRVRKCDVPPASTPGILATMRGNRGKHTGPERRLHAALARAGMRGYQMNVVGIPGRPDFVFVRERVAVFVHGCFWHRCPYCRPTLPKRHRAFWRRKFISNRLRDAKKRHQLETAGWRVVEFWECQVRDELARCVRVAKAALDPAAYPPEALSAGSRLVADTRRGGRQGRGRWG